MEKIKLNFRPILDEKNIIVDVKIKNENEKHMGRGIGKEVFFETGCQVSLPFKKAGLKSKCLEQVPITSKKIILKRKSIGLKIYFKMLIRDDLRFSHNKFFEYHYNEKLFSTHLGSGGYIGFNNPYALLWKERVKHHLEFVLFL
jgi:hypothetical protein